MTTENTARVRRDSLLISSTVRTGWSPRVGHVPHVGEFVMCVEGEAEVIRLLGRTSDGSRLLELRLPDRPKVPFFAASSNVLHRDNGSNRDAGNAAG